MPNSIYIDVTDDAEPPQWFSLKETEAFLNTLLDTCLYRNWELSVVFCSNAFIQKLNKEYRGLDEPTDVLSFSQAESENGEPLKPAFTEHSELDFIDWDDFPLFTAGDIVISFEALHKNAQDFSVPDEQELKRLLVHGVLHLAGYDHQTNDPAEPMLVLQEKILAEVEHGRV
jgi:metalloprotein, YbeY family